MGTRRGCVECATGTLCTRIGAPTSDTAAYYKRAAHKTYDNIMDVDLRIEFSALWIYSHAVHISGLKGPVLQSSTGSLILTVSMHRELGPSSQYSVRNISILLAWTGA